jgi:hypothetical protein
MQSNHNGKELGDMHATSGTFFKNRGFTKVQNILALLENDEEFVNQSGELGKIDEAEMES